MAGNHSPGPGLGIRVIGEVTEEKLKIVRDADAILREEIANAGLDKEIWQYFVALPGIRSVGVMGDGRTYDYAGCHSCRNVDRRHDRGLCSDPMGCFANHLSADR